MSGSPFQAISYLISTFVDLYVAAILLRLLLQIVRADFYNPMCQFLIKVTNPVLIPFRAADSVYRPPRHRLGRGDVPVTGTQRLPDHYDWQSHARAGADLCLFGNQTGNDAAHYLCDRDHCFGDSELVRRSGKTPDGSADLSADRTRPPTDKESNSPDRRNRPLPAVRPDWNTISDASARMVIWEKRSPYSCCWRSCSHHPRACLRNSLRNSTITPFTTTP